MWSHPCLGKGVAIGCSSYCTLELPALLVQELNAGIVGIYSSNRNCDTDALPTALKMRINFHST